MNRTNFVRNLTKLLQEYDKKESIVISLCGPWGSGKTSLLNLLEKEINHSYAELDMEMPIVIRFNPWNFSSIDQLIKCFFNELNVRISHDSKKPIVNKIGKTLKDMGTLLSPLSIIIPLGVASTSFKAVGEVVEKNTEQVSLEKIKEDLDKYLQEYGKKIIILIDDIDRLDKESIKLMFRLVNLNLNFSNILYILSYDRDIVEVALSEKLGISGREYLKKITQVSFDLPDIDYKNITEMFVKELNSLLVGIPLDEDDYKRLWDLYESSIQKCIHSIRDFKYFFNSLNFTFQLIEKEVNPVDFITLEIFRVFFPTSYKLIRENRHNLVFRQHLYEVEDGGPHDIIRKIEEEESNNIIKPMLSSLFPDWPKEEKKRAELRTKKRICCKEFVDRYFLFDLPEGDLSSLEIQEALNSLDDLEVFRNYLNKFNEERNLGKFLLHLYDYRFYLDISELISLIITLGGIDMVNANNVFPNIPQIMNSLITRIATLNPDYNLKSFLKSLIVSGNSLYNSVGLVGILEKDILYEPDYFLSNSDISELKFLAHDRIKQKIKDNQLIDCTNFESIFYYWSKWNYGDASKFLSTLLTNIDTIPKILPIFLEGSYPTNKHEKYFSNKKILIDRLKEFTDLGELEKKVEIIKNENVKSLSNEEKEAIDIFIRDIKIKDRTKSAKDNSG